MKLTKEVNGILFVAAGFFLIFHKLPRDLSFANILLIMLGSLLVYMGVQLDEVNSRDRKFRAIHYEEWHSQLLEEKAREKSLQIDKSNV